MPSLDELLATDEEPVKRASLDELLAADDSRSSKPFKPPTEQEIADLREWDKQGGQPRKWWEKAARGANDPLLGIGQTWQNVLPDSLLNAGRKLTDPVVNLVMGGDPVDSSNTTTADFNAGVRRMEQGTQARRAEGGEDGLDWWRIGGNVANPMTWPGAAPGGPGILQGIMMGAKSGAFQALLQPVTSEGSFLWNKGMQELLGAGVGGTLGGALAALKPAFAYGRKVIDKVSGAADDLASKSERVTNESLKAANVDASKVDPSLYSAMRQEVADAIKAGVDPDPTVMTNRADAGALPVPIDLTRGQASRDPMQFAWEHRAAGQQGAGEPITALLKDQNRKLIENLNVLGARNAPSQFDASNALISHIQGVDDALKSQIDTAYSAVRDSAGRPALMDHVTFVKKANDAIDHGQLGPYLPGEVRQQLNDIAEGKLPLTVNVAQQLDKVWNDAQRGAQNGSAKRAIGELRTALNDAPVTDVLGQESMSAYKAARELAKQRFSLIDQNPAYKAVTESVEPDKFFQKYVVGANVSDLKSLKNLVGADNTRLLQNTMIGNLKSKALSKASDENGVFSQAAYNSVLQDPVQAPRIAELFSDNRDTLGQLYRIGRVSENLIKIPAGSKVNTSNTASAVSNVVRDVSKSQAADAAWSLTRMGGVRQIVKEAKKRAEVEQGVSQAIAPGVTKNPLVPPATRTQHRLTDLAARTGVAAAASDNE